MCRSGEGDGYWYWKWEYFSYSFLFFFSPMAAVKNNNKNTEIVNLFSGFHHEALLSSPEKHLNRNLLQFSTSNILNTSNRRIYKFSTECQADMSFISCRMHTLIFTLFKLQFKFCVKLNRNIELLSTLSTINKATFHYSFHFRTLICY